MIIPFKDNFSKDIKRSTISSLLKQTVILADKNSDESQALSNVKERDVRAMAASLTFKGGVCLDQILGTCFWKSTSTSFYLKDVAWKSTEGSNFSLGPVVSSQHIV